MNGGFMQTLTYLYFMYMYACMCTCMYVTSTVHADYNHPSVHHLHVSVQWDASIVDMFGTTQSVLFIGGVLISGEVLYTPLCNWDHSKRPE